MSIGVHEGVKVDEDHFPYVNFHCPAWESCLCGGTLFTFVRPLADCDVTGLTSGFVSTDSSPPLPLTERCPTSLSFRWV